MFMIRLATQLAYKICLCEFTLFNPRLGYVVLVVVDYIVS